jgi:hypothetical protein
MFLPEEEAERLDNAERLGLTKIDEVQAEIRLVNFYEVANIHESSDKKTAVVHNSAGRWDCVMTVPQIEAILAAANGETPLELTTN